MYFCSNCVMPSTRPDLEFDEEGKCDACRTADRKYHRVENGVDWEARKIEFEELIERCRSEKVGQYDCIIPVSGGKDSTYQVHVAKNVYGLRPLCLYFYPTIRTELGERNLEALSRMGVDMFEVRRNPLVYEKLSLEAFKRVGDMEWPNHVGIWSTPYRFAVAFDIPLILWGEGRMEYAGTEFISEKHLRELDEDWAADYGCMNGLRAEDFVGPETGLTMDDIQTYKFPPMEELTKVGGNKGVTGIFLGYFFNWKVRENVAAIEQYGWSHHDGRPETTYCDFNNLDCLSMNLYDYVKYCKYGYGRATDDACRDVRDEIIDRKQAVRLVERYDGVYPKATVKAWAEKFGLTPEDFDEICDRFTNPEIFEYEDGKFVRDIDNSLIMRQEILDRRRNPNDQ